MFQFALDPSSHVPLTQAIEMDRPDIVKMLIAHPKINPNVVVSCHNSDHAYTYYFAVLGQ